MTLSNAHGLFRRRPREFASVEHLNSEAMAAFVDGELDPVATHRARVHLVQCPTCRVETHLQRRARCLLRGLNDSREVSAPPQLMARLASIASGGRTEGPSAADVPSAQPEDFLDRVETVLRALRRLHTR